MTRNNALVLVSILVIFVIGFYIHTEHNEYRAPLAFCAIAAAFITFFAILSGERTQWGGIDINRQRDTKGDSGFFGSRIPGALVGMFAFWGEKQRPPRH